MLGLALLLDLGGSPLHDSSDPTEASWQLSLSLPGIGVGFRRLQVDATPAGGSARPTTLENPIAHRSARQGSPRASGRFHSA